MALTLVVEDGTGKADANAFVSSATATLTATLGAPPWLDIAYQQ